MCVVGREGRVTWSELFWIATHGTWQGVTPVPAPRAVDSPDLVVGEPCFLELFGEPFPDPSQRVRHRRARVGHPIDHPSAETDQPIENGVEMFL